MTERWPQVVCTGICNGFIHESSTLPVAVRVAKVEACDGSIRNVVIRCVLRHAIVGVTNLVSAIATEVQAASGGVELHSHNVPGACSSAYVCIQALADTNPASALQQWHLSPSQLSIVSGFLGSWCS